jgi:hypothetical protein
MLRLIRSKRKIDFRTETHKGRQGEEETDSKIGR